MTYKNYATVRLLQIIYEGNSLHTEPTDMFSENRRLGTINIFTVGKSSQINIFLLF
jgi:hypothetical protein